MQEAYCPPCSEYSFCCPTRVPPLGGYLTWVPPRGVPGGTWPGYPPGGIPGGVPDLGTPRVPPGGSGGVTWPGYPPGTPRGDPGGTWPGYPPGRGGLGTPPGGTWPRYPPWGGTQKGVPRSGTPPGGTWGYLTRVPPLGGTRVRYPGGSGYPPRGVCVPPRGTWPGYPPWGVPRRGVPGSGTPPWGGYPGGTWPGYPPGGGTLVRYPGGAGYPPPLPHGILGNVAKHYGIWVPPLWTDRLMDGQTRVKTLPSLVLCTRAVTRICMGFHSGKHLSEELNRH